MARSSSVRDGRAPSGCLGRSTFGEGFLARSPDVGSGMSFKISQRRVWDATAMLEAMGAAEVALWLWEPELDRLRVSGAARALGLGPLAPDCSSAAFRALSLPQDRA